MIAGPTDEVRARALAYGADLDGALGASLCAYLTRLLTVNRSMNLTAITDAEEAWTKHVLDSLSLLPLLESLKLGEAARAVDVGSGGGLPALPLALALPGLRFTLLEATQKKAAFLAETAHELGLSNVEVVAERAETAGHGPLRESFVVATARAVSRLPVLLELTLPLLQKGGTLLAIKGAQAELEVQEAENAARILGGALGPCVRTETGTIVRVSKVAPSPAKYPRRPGEPNRAPLV